MGDKKEESRATREGINEALKEEFYKIHERVITTRLNIFEIDDLCDLVKTQIALAQQIVREERALSGESGYKLPPHYGVDG